MLDKSGHTYWMTESDRSVYNEGFIIKTPYWEYLSKKDSNVLLQNTLVQMHMKNGLNLF